MSRSSRVSCEWKVSFLKLGSSCCTCHVYLDENLLSLVPPPDKGELDMLDLAYEPKLESRLGCQIRLTPDLLQQIDNNSPIVVTIPADVNNVWT